MEVTLAGPLLGVPVSHSRSLSIQQTGAAWQAYYVVGSHFPGSRKSSIDALSPPASSYVVNKLNVEHWDRDASLLGFAPTNKCPPLYIPYAFAHDMKNINMQYASVDIFSTCACVEWIPSCTNNGVR